MFEFYNPNPCGRAVGDCSVRAVSKALGWSWRKAFLELMIEGYTVCDMPSANAVWGNVLRRHGFRKYNLDSDGYVTADEFCQLHPTGTYVVAMNSHVAAIDNGVLYDAWDSGREIVYYAWVKNERKKSDAV